MRVALRVTSLEGRRLTRRRWVTLLALAGLPAAIVIALVALGAAEADRLDALRTGSASSLLLGGLFVAAVLGGSALNTDSDSGHFGALLGNGARRWSVVAGAMIARLAALVAIIAVWGIAFQGASLAVGEGYDSLLASHTLLMLVPLALTLTAAAAASSVVKPAASALFGLIIFVTAQSMTTLKAAADQQVIVGAVRDGINGAAVLSPQVPTSRLVEELQARGTGGPAVPRIDVNGNEVLLFATGWQTLAWALAWCVLLGLLAYLGMRRRPIF